MKERIKISPQTATVRANLTTKHNHYNKKQYLRTFNHLLLPTPLFYYQQQFPFIKSKSGWTQVRCCFHDDHTPSLSINLLHGNFICFACGAKGGDVIDFHRLRYKKDFISTVTELGAYNHGR